MQPNQPNIHQFQSLPRRVTRARLDCRSGGPAPWSASRGRRGNRACPGSRHLNISYLFYLYHNWPLKDMHLKIMLWDLGFFNAVKDVNV